MNLKKFKKLSGDASFRQFYRTNNSVLVYCKIQKRTNLLNYDAVNKILIKNKILAPGLISQNYKKNFIENYQFIFFGDTFIVIYFLSSCLYI